MYVVQISSRRQIDKKFILFFLVHKSYKHAFIKINNLHSLVSHFLGVNLCITS
jgi:hypothetical protein